MRVHEIRGAQLSTAARLAEQGVKTADDLLLAAKTAAGRKELAAKVGVDTKEILELANRADLARVQGIGEVYSNLLEQAGVDTIVELSRRVPANLQAKLLEFTQAGHAHRAPTLAQVEDWVTQAKALGRGARVLVPFLEAGFQHEIRPPCFSPIRPLHPPGRGLHSGAPGPFRGVCASA